MASLITWKFPKDPDETLDYDLDWSRPMTKDGDTIVMSIWDVPDELVVEDESFTTTHTKITLSGGVAGSTHTLVNTIVTSGGRTFQRSRGLKVAER